MSHPRNPPFYTIPNSSQIADEFNYRHTHKQKEGSKKGKKRRYCACNIFLDPHNSCEHTFKGFSKRFKVIHPESFYSIIEFLRKGEFKIKYKGTLYSFQKKASLKRKYVRYPNSRDVYLYWTEEDGNIKHMLAKTTYVEPYYTWIVINGKFICDRNIIRKKTYIRMFNNV